MNKILSSTARPWLTILSVTLVIALSSAHSRAANCTQAPLSGQLYKITNLGSGHNLDVAGASTEAGANVLQWTDNGRTNQQFTLNDLGNGYWSIIARHSGQSLDVWEWSSADGGDIRQWTSTGASNQQWQLKKSTTGAWNIVSRYSGKSLTAESSARGANVHQYSDSASGLQRWYFNPVSGGCGQSVDGFASQSGSDGLSTTTGGGSATPVTVTSCSALKSALESSGAAVVQVPDNTTIDCLTEGRPLAACQVACPDYQDSGEFTYRIPVGSQTCVELGSDSNDTTTVYRFDTRINVADNKTLVGLGANSTIEGASLNLSGAKNVIVRNLSIANVNPHLVEGGDGITLDGSSHVWVDHVGFSMISDGHVDIRDSANVTLSNNHFDGRNNYVCANQHWYTSAVVNSQVTYHHNFFDYTGGRNPKLDGSTTRGHLYNNYYLEVTYFGINASNGAHALVESNYFADTRYPHWNESGYMSASGNVYTGQSATDSERDSGDTVFWDVNMYNYSPDDASGLTSLDGTTGPR
ncbi:RICIN domain-containing protein [Microbulbifer rhizosphaerae]|uniref:pectin lyase n=1 Tax=Microbulbifer rhizosphaerae TaxID=1562603 RepID=A0A7W4WF48_9GAMM|nr:RICIN domain-containing protein [Microbulbifer rhizosphaerae]MBB3062513.1 pectate lyase [Microbulbifer rhizosphaerae]